MTDFARLVLDADTRGLKRGERDLDALDRQAAKTAREVDSSANRMGASFKRIGAAVVAAGIGTVIYDFGKKSAQAAIDAQEMESAFNVVFGNMADDVKSWAETTGDALGRSTQEIQRGALAFQELFGKALQPEKAAELSKQFAVLTQDLASFKNLSNEVAQQKLFSGLIGEAEPLRAVGVFLSETAVKAKAAELGLGGINKELTDQEKIVVRAALIQEELAQASGDVERTSDSAANQIKALNAAFEELRVAVGNNILPLLTPLVSGLAGVVDTAAKVVQGFDGVGISLNGLMNFVGAAVGGWAAYRIALLAGAAATAAMNSALVFNASVVLSTARSIGIASAAQVAFSGATAAATGIVRGLTAALIANPFTAVAVVVGTLTAAMIGLGNAQKQAKADTDNLIRSLKGLAEARAANFQTELGKAGNELTKARERRAKAEIEEAAFLRRLNIDPNKPKNEFTFAEQAKVRTFGREFQRISDELFASSIEAFDIEVKITEANRAFESATKEAEVAANALKSAQDTAANTSTNFVALSADTGKLGDEAKRAAEEFQSLQDRLNPTAAAAREFAREMSLIQNARVDDAKKEVLITQLEAEAFRNRTSALGDARVSRGLLNQGALPTIDNGDINRTTGQISAQLEADRIIKETGNMKEALKVLAKASQDTTKTVAESFGQMADRTIQAFDRMISSIQGGGFFGILNGLLNFGIQLGGIGVFGKDIQGRINSAPSFAGGGFTGMGARAGGLDGKGGFMAMLHPRETVIDHTRGQGGGVHVTVGVDPRTGNLLAFTDSRIAATAPAIASAGANIAQAQMANSARRRIR